VDTDNHGFKTKTLVSRKRAQRTHRLYNRETDEIRKMGFGVRGHVRAFKAATLRRTPKLRQAGQSIRVVRVFRGSFQLLVAPKLDAGRSVFLDL
jgi:hypothetical protein